MLLLFRRRSHHYFSAHNKGRNPPVQGKEEKLKFLTETPMKEAIVVEKMLTEKKGNNTVLAAYHKIKFLNLLTGPAQGTSGSNSKNIV